MCGGCKQMLCVQKWSCNCDKPWLKCNRRIKAGDVFRRIKNKKVTLKNEEEHKRDVDFMQGQIAAELNEINGTHFKHGCNREIKEMSSFNTQECDEVRRRKVTTRMLRSTLVARFRHLCTEGQDGDIFPSASSP